MALQHLRSNTASKRPTAGAMSDGQIAINTNATSPGLFFKDASGAIIKVGPVHVGTSAPNSTPAGSAGNGLGEQWLDTSGGGYVLKIWDGSAWRSEAGEFVDAAGDTMTGDLVMNNANIVFEGSTDDGFETTLTVVDPTADRTITLPNVTGTVVTTGDTGTVTSTMIADGTIVNADINASAAIALSKLATGALPTAITVASANIVDGTIVNADVNASAAIAGTKIDPDFGSQTVETTGVFSAAGGAAATPSITFTGDLNTGIYSPGADQVAISTNGTERVEFGTSKVVFNDGGANYDFRIEGDTNSSLFFVDASTDRVGVGTTEPNELLHVNGTGATVACRIRNDTGTAGQKAALYLTTSATSTFNSAGIEAVRDNGSTDALAFIQGNNEKARIDGSGRLLVGTPPSPAYQLQLDTDSAGKPSTNTWTIVSDERIKEEIELADLDLCYEAVKNIPLKRFKWKDEVYTEDQAYDRRKLGWIAQDVEAVFPKAVRQHEFKYNQVFEEVIVPAVPAELDEDGNVITEEQPERIEKGELISEEVIEDCRDLNSDQLYAAMYGAIQKLIGKVETLEAEIAALKV